MLIARTVEESRIFLLPELRVAPAKPPHNQRRRANPADFVGGFVVEQRLPLPVYQALLRCRDQDISRLAPVRPIDWHAQGSTIRPSITIQGGGKRRGVI